jgi:hypothetical protein
VIDLDGEGGCCLALAEQLPGQLAQLARDALARHDDPAGAKNGETEGEGERSHRECAVYAVHDRLGCPDEHKAPRDRHKADEGAPSRRTDREREENDDGDRHDDDEPKLRERWDAADDAADCERERGAQWKATA